MGEHEDDTRREDTDDGMEGGEGGNAASTRTEAEDGEREGEGQRGRPRTRYMICDGKRPIRRAGCEASGSGS